MGARERPFPVTRGECLVMLRGTERVLRDLLAQGDPISRARLVRIADRLREFLRREAAARK